MRIAIGEVTLQCLLADIVDQPDIDAIVNAANAALKPGGGVAGAIHRAAGPELERACAPLAPISPGEAVITDGFNLPNRHIIHCLGPVHGRDEPANELLAAGHIRCLELADNAGDRSIAFPAVSTGAFGYPIEEAAKIACNTVTAEARKLKQVGLVRFVLWQNDAYDAYSRQLVKAAAREMG